jgi:hypothetical protein
VRSTAADGIWWLFYASLDIAHYLKESPRTTYLISYPKCGVTWLKFMLCELINRCYSLGLEKPTVLLDEVARKRADVPRLVWTHDHGEVLREDGSRPDPYRLFKYGGRLRYGKNAVLFLIRDPRDVVVSLYHQLTRRSERAMEFESMSGFVRDPVYGIERVIRFYNVWYHQRRIPRRFLVTRYEDLSTNGEEELTSIAQFIGIRAAARDLIEEVYEFASADTMRRLETRGDVDGMRSFGTDLNALKVRKAKIGSFREELSGDDIEFCNRFLGRLPHEWGYRSD